MSLPRWALSAVLVSTLSLGLTGCGDKDPSSSESAGTAGQATDDSSPADATGTPSEAPADDAAGGGAADVSDFLGRLKAGVGDAGSAHLTMSMSGGPSTVSMAGDMSYGDKAGPQMRVRTTIPGTNAQAEVLVTGGKAYMSVPQATPPGKYFQLPEDSPLLQGITQGPGSLSLDQSFKAFDVALVKVRDLGDDEVGGDPAHHYKLWVDSKKSLAASGMAGTPAGKAALGAMPKTLVYDCWLDGDDHMRRMTFAIPPIKVVMDMTKWGEPVHVEPPAKSDLVQAPAGLAGTQMS